MVKQNEFAIKKYNVENIGELGVDKLPPHSHLDGVTRNEVERICIEHPEFFSKFTSPHVKTMCFDIETYSADSTFPFGEAYPVVSIGVKTDDNEHKVFFWDRENENDKPCIQGFLDYILEYDPDIIYGYNNIAYDIPQIQFRAKKHGIDIEPYFNRDFRKTELKQNLTLKKEYNGVLGSYHRRCYELYTQRLCLIWYGKEFEKCSKILWARPY